MADQNQIHIDDFTPDPPQQIAKPAGPGRGGKTAPPPVAKPNALEEIGGDIWNTVKGAWETAKSLPLVTGTTPAGFSFPSSPQEQVEKANKVPGMAKEVVAAPVRALKGEAQPGQPPESRPQGWVERPLAALDLLLGGDPGEAKLRGARGDQAGAVSSLVTGPLLLHGVSKLTEGAKPAKPVGPQPKSALPELRKNIPEFSPRTGEATSRLTERIMRIMGPGKYLPNESKRRQLLSSSIGNGKVNVPDALKAVLPELDKTARDWGTHPKGIVSTESLERPGEGITEAQTLNRLMENTMTRLEGDYQGVLQDVNPAQTFSTDSIADMIDKQQTPGMIDMAAASPESDVGKTVKYLNETANFFRGKSFPIKSLDDLRKYYYSASKAGEAGRIAQRSNEAVMADTAIERGLREKIYNELEKQAQAQGKDPGFIRDLKDKQRHIYELLDISNPSAVQTLNKEAIERGYNWIQKQNITAALHPETLSAVGSIHGLREGAAGTSTSLRSNESRVQRAFAEKGVPTKASSAFGQAVKDTAIGTKEISKEGLKRSALATATRPTKQPPNGTVQMRAPNGSLYRMPASEVERAKADGLVVVQ